MADNWTPTDDEYFAARDWLSHSEFKLFTKSPRLYERHAIHGVPVKRTEAMEFGTDVDTAVFHPDGFAAGIAIAPESVLGKGGIRAGAAYHEFVAANPGKVICKRNDPLIRVLDSLHDHAEARGVLEAPGRCQVAIRWECEVNGVALKRRAKLDKLPDNLQFLADLKTTKDVSASAFAKDIITLKYHTQAEWYRDAVEAKYGVRPPFIIVAVQNCEPHDTEVYELNESFLMLGRKLIDDKLPEFVACRAAGKWRATSHDQIVKLAPPYWAEKELTAWNL